MDHITAIGIDLGTTNSCVAIFDTKKQTHKVITNTVGKYTTPSYVSFTDTDTIVGHEAKKQSVANSDNTIFDIKRLIGLRFEDKIVESLIKDLPYKVINEDSKIKIKVQHKKLDVTLLPEEISAMILKYLKNIAEDYLGHPVTNAVITVPAYFGNAQREATTLAGEIAGLNVLRIVNEPTAAAIAYRYEITREKQIILVYDFGGGTFDVSILKNNKNHIAAMAVHGDTHLGGNDIDRNFANYIIDNVKKKYKIDLSTNKKAVRRIIRSCEKMKIILSTAKSTTLELENISDDLNLLETVDRESFENTNESLFKSTLIIVDKCLSDANLKTDEIDEIILVGGTTRIPKVQEILQNHFNGKKLCKSVNPDESVAIGAALLASNAIKEPSTKNLLKDVIPKSLGISVVNRSSADSYNDLLDIVVKNNTTIPTKTTKLYTTSEDYQSSIIISIYEGENRLAKDNYLLDTFNLEGITIAPAGKTKCNVTFIIDCNGIIKVYAREINGKTSNSVTIVRNGALSYDDIKRIIKTARN